MKQINVVLLVIFLSILTISMVYIVSNNGKLDNNSSINLWNYTANSSGEVAIPNNYQDYIMQDNPLVKKYADNLELKGRFFRYKDSSVFFIIPKEDENGTDYWQNPDYTLKVKTGDCDDMALLAASFLAAKGIPSVVVTGFLYDDNGSGAHIWAEYNVNGTYYVVSNFHAFPRKIEVENGIIYYSSPALILTSTANESDKIEIPSEKFQPTSLFNKEIKKGPYNKDWMILI